MNYLHARMHKRGPKNRAEEWMWRFHWHHHAADARVNFGLTNPLLDFVLGTVFAVFLGVPHAIRRSPHRDKDGQRISGATLPRETNPRARLTSSLTVNVCQP